MQVASVTSGGQQYGYTYDSMGNIATYSAPGKATVTYTYDNQGQLLKATGDTTYTYTYDGAGNILTASNGTTTHTYTYGDSNWKDLLTAFDGQSIAYDSIGNPLSYYNGTRWNFTWANGRSLATASDGSNSLSFAYDASGLRTSKVVNGTTYRYYYAGGKLMRMTWGTNTIDFFYDANGAPYAMKYNGTVYYYVTNLQGDVMRIVNASGTVVASYDYDPYGKVISATGTLANVNPLRYRGYVYDQETGFYYLQSRYYDPATGRFLNADSYASTGQGIIGYNMFAYCLGDPVNFTDNSGEVAVSVSVWSAFTLSQVIEAFLDIALGASLLLVVKVPGPAIERIDIGSFEDEIRERMGQSLAVSITSTYKSEIEYHHIVAHRAAKAAPAAEILNKVLPGGVENRRNIVALNTKIHRRLHTNLYYSFVNLVIVGAYKAANGDAAKEQNNVLAALDSIKTDRKSVV